MDAERKHAYRLMLSAAMLHVKWDLGCLFGGFSWRPWRFRNQTRSARRAAARAATFHNLATFATFDFADFSEERFWQDVERFLREFPESQWANYRSMFEHSLRGHKVRVSAPGGGVPTDIPVADEALPDAREGRGRDL